jgi:type 1 fimbria pilin
MPDYIPKPDNSAQAFINTVTTALEADEAAFGITPAQSAAVRAALTAFSNALVAANNAKGAANVAVADKDAKRRALEDLLRPLVQQIQVNPAVTDAARVSAGIPIRDTTRTFTNPVPPVNLVAVADPAGSNNLKWDSGGNAAGVQYVVEAKTGNGSDFVLVDVTSARTFKHTGQAPGVRVEYRVRARRGAATSGPSNTATVYA